MAHSGWRVTAEVPDQIINTDAGKTETGTFIYLVTGDGNPGVIFVANRHIGSTKTVRRMLHAEAQLRDHIANQTSKSVAASDAEQAP